MHKNTFVFVVLLTLFAALVTVVNLTNRQPAIVPSVTPTQTPTATVVQMKTYTNDICGITLLYPDSLQTLESTTSGAIFINTENAAESIILTCQPEIPRVPLPLNKIETVVLESTNGATFAASLYHDTSQKDGTPIDKLIFTHPDKNIDVFIAGLGDLFTQIIASLKVLPH